MSTPDGSPAPGWYDDGSGTGVQRYWDGSSWTQHTIPAPQGQPAAPGTGYGAPGGDASAAAYGAAYPGATTATARTVHPLGWVALAAAVVGFVFACIPGALIIGWVLLPIAFILSIIGFFVQGRKWPVVTALVLSVVGTIVGFIVFFTVVSDSVDEAFGGSDVTVTTPDAEDSAPAEDEGAADGTETDAEQEAASEPGSRDNPVPLGSVISGDDFDVTINSVQLDATDAVMAPDLYNEPAPEGFTYALINATITYTGAESDWAMAVNIDYVASTGEVLDATDVFASPPEPRLGHDELYTGGTTSGNTVIAVPTGDTGLLRVRPGPFADAVFVATQ
jgi:energy-coupling factor transporter transmembrane protein EcfT